MKYAACVILQNSEGQILSVGRKNNPEDKNLPGGKLDPEDNGSFEVAAIRETKEETGLDIFNLKEVYHEICVGDVTYDTVCFMADWSGEIHTKEIGHVEWIHKRDLLKGSFQKYNIGLYKILGWMVDIS